MKFFYPHDSETCPSEPYQSTANENDLLSTESS